MRRILSLLLCASLSANDKLDHFAAGFAIGAAVTVSFKWSGGPAKQSARIGFLVGTGAGIVKEGVDQYVYQKGNALNNSYMNNPDTAAYARMSQGSFGKGADAGDALATIAGAAVGSWLTYELLK